MKNQDQIKSRLEYLRGELRAEQISYGELHELYSLASHIEPGDVELLEAAGVPEFEQITCPECCGSGREFETIYDDTHCHVCNGKTTLQISKSEIEKVSV